MRPNYTIEKAAYERFLREFPQSDRARWLRLGQAFVQDFKLDRMSDKSVVDPLYQMDGEKAKAFIAQNFELS